MEFHKVLVPVTGSDADVEALRLAIRLAKKEKGKVWSVYVITIKRALPLNAEIKPEIEKAEGVMDNMETIAEEEEEYEVDTDILQSRDAGPAIIDEAVERGVDLILMGVKYKKRFGQFSLGSVVPYILKNSPCPVILCQQ
jgi:nucleotide-binding universal stress UspA family protein